MADKSTFIMIDRNILDWRWWKDSKTYHLFSWLIMKANIKDHPFKKVVIPRGSIATSYESMADGCGMSVMSARRVIRNLEETGEIERTVKDHYQIIKIVNYDAYQGCSRRTPKQQPTEQPVEQPIEQANNNNQIIYNNGNNGKNGKRKINNKKSITLPLNGASDVPKALRMKPIDEGTVDDIPEDVRDLYKTYAEYWRFVNQ